MAIVFYTFRDAPQRRRALEAEPGSAERYLLFGLDQVNRAGTTTSHNLERGGPPPAWARAAGAAVKWPLERAGGYGGDFATVFAALRTANRADVVFSTVDTVGIPLMLLERAGRLRPPLLYAAIGLPERLGRLRNDRMRRLYASALGSCATVLAYSEHEADELRTWLRAHGETTRVVFVPFGVDVESFKPSLEPPNFDVVSVGADPHRDFDLLLQVASRMPDKVFRIVTTSERLKTLEHQKPDNVKLEADLPFAEMRARLEQARAVALPVRENSYSGATTVLLQAMALGKPVVVSRTRAIASGYGLVDGENCRLVPPGDRPAFERALGEVLADEPHARSLAAHARATAEQELSWERYVDRIDALLTDAAGASADGRSRPS